MLMEVFRAALDLFNMNLDSDITEENTFLAFFTPETGKDVYESFCNQYFPKNLNEPYLEDGYFETFAAQAFINDQYNGILFRSDLNFSLAEIHYTFLHEIAHIFCTRNEIKGGHFFDRYCMGSGDEDGIMNAGYAVWREAVADIMASSILSETTGVKLLHIQNTVTDIYNMISIDNPDSKKCMSLIIAYIMNTAEVAGTENWSLAKKAITDVFDFDKTTIFILERVFTTLHESPFWTITPDFIMDLGEAYISVLRFQTFRFLN